MNADQLKEQLLAAGCSANNFAINSRGSDCYCLCHNGNEWQVFYSERGQDESPIFTSKIEEEACQFFYEQIIKLKHWHLVGFFKAEPEAQALEASLRAIEIEPIRNDIPAYHSSTDPRYRVFVLGKDIIKFREKFGEPTLNYD